MSKIKNRYKKGDWVCFKHYKITGGWAWGPPVKLLTGGKLGWLLINLTGKVFVKSDKQTDLNLDYCVLNPVLETVPEPQRYVSVDNVRRATKKDFELCIKETNKHIRSLEKGLHDLRKIQSDAKSRKEKTFRGARKGERSE